MWAVAALLHLVGNQSVATPTATLLLGAGIAIALLRPSRPWAIVPLAVAQLASAWMEAPVLGNHWLVAALVALAALLVIARRVVTRVPLDGGSTMGDLAPVARWTLLGFYAFAAFAKLNSDFFDPAVSCATFYFNESTRSIGLESLQLGGAGWLQWVVVISTAAIELSIPLLLLWRRTRRWWVLVALIFHVVLALDLAHQFYDFSSMLAALFVLFLPAGFAGWVAERARRVRLPRLAQALPALAAALVALRVADVRPNGIDHRLVDLGHVLWLPYALALLVAVGAYLRAASSAPDEPSVLRLASPVLLLVPALVLVNGLTPYLEIKTGYGFNMYANLRTVDGETNHLLVPRTIPLTDQQDEIVTIVYTSDPALETYAVRDFGLTSRQLRIYLSHHPGTEVVYERGGRRLVVQATDEVEPVPIWVEKLLLFRPIDLQARERCVPAFGPAR
jgi:hypothetical protein